MSEIKSSVSKLQTVDNEARDSVSCVEQQLKLLSINSASSSRSSNDVAFRLDNIVGDDRVLMTNPVPWLSEFCTF